MSGVEDGAEVVDFLGDRGLAEIAFGAAIAGEGEAEGVKTDEVIADVIEKVKA